MTVTSQKLKIDSDRMRADFDELAQIGATVGGGTSRVALSNEDLEARAWFANKIEEAGLFLRDDEVGNLSGVLLSPITTPRTLLTGSHLDTVPNGGLYDGVVGVLAGLECLRTIKEAGLTLPVNLEVIDFTDEEGWWQSFFGSMGLIGSLTDWDSGTYNQDKGAFRAALFRAGIRPSEIGKARRDPENIVGFVELHIEQSNRLDSEGADIGVVTGVVGRTTYTITFYGEATHAATTDPAQRRDALRGASLFITRLYDQMRDEHSEGVVNCGDLTVKPGTVNVVPAMASLRVEIRHESDAALNRMESQLVRLAQDIAREHRLFVNTHRMIHRPAAYMAPEMIREIEAVCDSESYKHRRLISYAGHDAQILAPFTPSAMIFIPSKDGISHNPKEHTTWEHIERGTTTLLHTLLRLALA